MGRGNKQTLINLLMEKIAQVHKAQIIKNLVLKAQIIKNQILKAQIIKSLVLIAQIIKNLVLIAQIKILVNEKIIKPIKAKTKNKKRKTHG